MDRPELPHASTTDASVQPGPLHGIKVLDLSRILAGPLSGQFLADMGADVLKVERPGSGDDSRRYGTSYLGEEAGQTAGRAEGLSGFFLSCNRGKRSIAIDIAHPDGQDLVRQLAADSDVLIENYRVGALQRYGLDYASLAALNPRLVYCSLTGFGQSGPLAQRPGYDGIFQAMGGLMSSSGHADDQPGGGPMKVGISIIDVIAGNYAASGILSALYARDTRTGRGQHIDLALLDACVATLTHFGQNFLISGKVTERRGNAGYGGVPSQTFRCADGSLFLTAGTERQFHALCHVLERPDLLTHPLCIDNHQRMAHRDAVGDLLETEFLKRPLDHWLPRLEQADVPASAINDVREVFENDQVRHRGMVTAVPEPFGGTMDVISNPLKLSDTPARATLRPPLLGEHTHAVLRDRLGLSDDAVSDLLERGVVGGRP